MVKKWFVMISLLIILVAGCVIESIYVNKSFDWLINSLETLQIELTENKEKCDTEELIKKAYNIHNEWDKKTKVLKCLIWHSGIKDIEIGMARVSVYVEENNYTEAYAEIAALIDYCSHYTEDFSISAENIF
ncbi:MAG: DUF4363 family protein [Clostridiales bacterium]|nr:DUF4363 family protein [Clostridiales bacterium]